LKNPDNWKHLLYALTSSAANDRASRLVQSKVGFISKQSIVIDEAEKEFYTLNKP